MIPLVDDVLVEQVGNTIRREHGEPYEEISNNNQDARALKYRGQLRSRRTVESSRSWPCKPRPLRKGAHNRLFRNEPPDTPLKQAYDETLVTDEAAKARMQADLRPAVPGSSDVNIMTKLDRDIYLDGNKLPAEFSDAMAASAFAAP